jgi:hypothetical protein
MRFKKSAGQSHITHHPQPADYSLPVTRHSLLVTRHPSLVTRYSSLVTRHPSLLLLCADPKGQIQRAGSDEACKDKNSG